jgi:hypothetical protein
VMSGESRVASEMPSGLLLATLNSSLATPEAIPQQP